MLSQIGGLSYHQWLPEVMRHLNQLWCASVYLLFDLRDHLGARRAINTY